MAAAGEVMPLLTDGVTGGEGHMEKDFGGKCFYSLIC